MSQCATRRPKPNNAPFAALIAALVANDERRIEDEAVRVVRDIIKRKSKPRHASR